MTCHGILDFIVWWSRSPLRKILIIVCNELSNRTKDRYDSKSCDVDIFNDCIFSVILSPELKNKLTSYENKDNKNLLDNIKTIIFLITQKYKPFTTELRHTLLSFVRRNQTWRVREHSTEDLLLFSPRQTFHRRFVALLLTANISQICCSSPHGKHFTENLLLFSSRQTFHRICCSSPHDKHFTEDLLLFSSRQTFHRRFVALLLTAND